MNTQKITESEIEDIKIASLPTRPTMPQAYGGIGYSSKDMKEAFDAADTDKSGTLEYDEYCEIIKKFMDSD